MLEEQRAGSGDLFDPSPVLELAKRQHPEDRRLHQAIAACTRVVRYCGCGCGTPYFVDVAAEVVGEDSDFGLRISLEQEDGPPVVVDLLPDGRVACIEGC